MMTFNVRTTQRSEFLDITGEIRKALTSSGIEEGIVTVFVPHTTAGITINENADPDVIRDIQAALERMVPWQHPAYRHSEGNSAAHIKSSLMGSSVSITAAGGDLKLGTWQSVFFCEFDGPRSRKVWIEITDGKKS
ncbi:MAG: YjbQ family protein [Elusimicrobia bacterium]|nr:YjbQ family protein [Elusimicrobiota bacterium]